MKNVHEYIGYQTYTINCRVVSMIKHRDYITEVGLLTGIGLSNIGSMHDLLVVTLMLEDEKYNTRNK